MYSLTQEIEVWYIIPAIRKELAKLLTGRHNYSYDKTAKILGISKAAIAQYIANKRANNVQLSEQTKKEIEKSAETITKNDKMAMLEIQRILTLMKETRESCTVCEKYNKGVLEYCNSSPTYIQKHGRL